MCRAIPPAAQRFGRFVSPSPWRRIAAAVCGLAAASWALVVTVVGALASPPYSHVSQFISELGASGAPHASLVAAAGFAPIGGLVLAFLALAAGSLPPSRRTAVGVLCFGTVAAAYLASAVFPCDAGCPSSGSFAQSVHNLFGLLEYVGAFWGLLLLAAAFRSSEIWRAAWPAGAVAALFVGVGFIAMLTPGLESLRGLSQRLAEAAIFLWIAYVSVFLLRQRGIAG